MMDVKMGESSMEVTGLPTHGSWPKVDNRIRNSLYRPRAQFVRFIQGRLEDMVWDSIRDDQWKDEEEGDKHPGDALPPELAAFGEFQRIAPSAPAGNLAGEWGCNYHLETVASLSPIQADRLLFGYDQLGEKSWWHRFDPMTLEVNLSYPMSVNVRLVVRPPTKNGVAFGSFGLFLLSIAKAYQDIYRDPKKHGIWGHGIGDLYLEGVSIRPGRPAEAWIGS